MKIIEKIICLILTLALVVCLGACGNSNSDSENSSTASSSEQSDDFALRSAISLKCSLMGKVETHTIGGNKIVEFLATPTYFQKVSETQYIVSGKFTMVDIYGTRWTNTFDCEVNRPDTNSSWWAEDFEFGSDKWTKS